MLTPRPGRRQPHFWATVRFVVTAFAVAILMSAAVDRSGMSVDAARVGQVRISTLHERAGAVTNDLDRMLLNERVPELTADLKRLDDAMQSVANVDGLDEYDPLLSTFGTYKTAYAKELSYFKAGEHAAAAATDNEETDPAYNRFEKAIVDMDDLCERRAKEGLLAARSTSLFGLLLAAGLVSYFAIRHRQKTFQIAETEAQKVSASTMALLQAKVNSSVDGILIVDPAGKVVLVNNRMGEVWGIPTEIFTSDDDSKLLEFVTTTVKDPESFFATVQRLYGEPLATSHDLIELKNGKVIDRHTGPAVSPDGAVHGRVWTFRDITERIRTEKALQDSERHLQNLMQSIPQVVWTCKTHGVDVSFNHQWAAYTGQTPAQMAGEGWKSAIHPDDWSDADVLGETPHVFEFENRLRRADGMYRWFLIRGIPITDDEGRAVEWYGTCTDIHDIKQSEELLREAQEELEKRVEERTRDLAVATVEAERANAAKSEFLSRMSHELRTPLNAILGFGQILARQELDALQQESVDYILKGGRHLLSLINEILDISRVEAGRADLSIEPVPAAEILHESLGMIRNAAADRGIELDDDLSGLEGVCVSADRQRLKQVFLNLLSNAVKYNRLHGRITVQVVSDGETVRIGVEDTGYGLSEEERVKLFIPFERLSADASVEGTGLGLFLTQKLMAAMGGALSVESEVGKGSIFWVELARVQTPTEAFLERGDLLPEADVDQIARPCSILSIEDNSANTRLLEMAVAVRPDATLQTATHGSEGLILARQAEHDLILLDLNLPDMHGVDVLKRLRRSATTRDVPVIVISADASQSAVDAAFAAGANAFFAKPLNVVRLLESIDRHLSPSSAEVGADRMAA